MDVSRLRESGLEAHGALPILLSDYGIELPTGLFGLIRCDDRVVVTFALTVTSSVAIAPTTALSIPH